LELQFRWEGLFINQRMADVRKAKNANALSQAERKLQAMFCMMLDSLF
jgi:hypothetical protein